MMNEYRTTQSQITKKKITNTIVLRKEGESPGVRLIDRRHCR